ncbi:Uma2 family endonuclease [Planktothrix mougeotii]|uniref:Uma2 family endonuclease n=1 Tax=Planktothrix mougeotii LEGE 06226 TaxID=1828728 RepID=A0ABR9U9N7_9CYAN|nr:Uma2 family endonuclease [Planktothrix mougeotii]MBE9143152.1 Uma2 family endonuclease [Planktothrix mougeotii LEGE 06226]
MAVTLELRQIEIQPGQHLILRQVSWKEFEAILEEMGEHRASRVAYCQGVLKIRMPLPEHEIKKELISDFVKILLDELELDSQTFGSTTFKRPEMTAGIEPDNCFYIQNSRLMIGKQRINLSVDPPPDLAIEVDVTSKTQLDAYLALGVPELWIYAEGKLQIFVLQSGEYVQGENSPNFINLPVIVGILQFLQQSETIGDSAARRGFRKWVRSQINL